MKIFGHYFPMEDIETFCRWVGFIWLANVVKWELVFPKKDTKKW